MDAATGSVLEFVHDDPVREVLGQSLREFLRQMGDDCDSGALHFEPKIGIIHERFLKDTPAKASRPAVYDTNRMPTWWFWPLMLAVVLALVAYALATKSG